MTATLEQLLTSEAALERTMEELARQLDEVRQQLREQQAQQTDDEQFPF